LRSSPSTVLLGCGSANVASATVSKRLRCAPVERRCCSRQPITVLPVSACAPIPGHLLTCRAIFSAATLLSSPSFIRTSSMAAASALRRSFFFFVRHRLFREEPRPASPLKVFEGLCNLHERGSVLCRPTSPFDEPRDRGTRQYRSLKSPVLRRLEDVGCRSKIVCKLSLDFVWNPRLIIGCRSHGASQAETFG